MRHDEYGGSFENRCRALLETVRRTRPEIPAPTLLSTRLSLFNKPPDAVTLEEFGTLLCHLEEAGVDLLHLSTDGAFKPAFGASKPLGKWARESTELPVMVAGGLGDPQEAERAIALGVADFAAIGSAMMEKADWTRKAREALS